MTKHLSDNALGSLFHFIIRRHKFSINFCQQMYWQCKCKLVTLKTSTIYQEWPGLCSSTLGSENLCSLCWQVGRVHSQACVCHVTFSSSVNVVDYFLRDQNWLPRIRAPSIFSRTSRTHGEAVWSGGSRERVRRRASRAGDEAVGQLVTQSPHQPWLWRFVTETFGEINKQTTAMWNLRPICSALF